MDLRELSDMATTKKAGKLEAVFQREVKAPLDPLAAGAELAISEIRNAFTDFKAMERKQLVGLNWKMLGGRPSEIDTATLQANGLYGNLGVLQQAVQEYKALKPESCQDDDGELDFNRVRTLYASFSTRFTLAKGAANGIRSAIKQIENSLKDVRERVEFAARTGLDIGVKSSTWVSPAPKPEGIKTAATFDPRQPVR